MIKIIRKIICTIMVFPLWLLYLCQSKEMKGKICDDINVYDEADCFCELMVLSRNFRTVFYTRIKPSFVKSICKRVYPGNASIDLACKNIGGGLRLMHSSGCTVLAKSIGKNCVIHQGVTIGVGNYSMNTRKKIPTIGDSVFIGANAIIIGGVTVGANAIIGAGSVVTHDVPVGATVVGNPARVIEKS